MKLYICLFSNSCSVVFVYLFNVAFIDLVFVFVCICLPIFDNFYGVVGSSHLLIANSSISLSSLSSATTAALGVVKPA